MLAHGVDNAGAPETTEQLYLYYQQSGLLPSFAGFQTKSELDAHQGRRENLFAEKLYLPPRLFKGAKVCEFGPDSGENALVFARWGADLTLVEPNPECWPCIWDYFDRFELRDRVVRAERKDVQSFTSDTRFDFINAEGLVHAVAPQSLWMQRFSDLLEDDGLTAISYCGTYGSFIELLQKAMFAAVLQLTGLSPVAAARKLFDAKWEAIPHTRSFEGWVVDVLQDPFVRLKYMIDGAELCTEMAQYGFQLYSSWPLYKDTLHVYWDKRQMPYETILEHLVDFVSRNRLSWALGHKLFMGASSAEAVANVNAVLKRLLMVCDGLVDQFDSAASEEGVDLVNQLSAVLDDASITTDGPGQRQEAKMLLAGIGNILRWLSGGEVENLVAFCNSDQTFLHAWGVPAHRAVFRKCASPA